MSAAVESKTRVDVEVRVRLEADEWAPGPVWEVTGKVVDGAGGTVPREAYVDADRHALHGAMLAAMGERGDGTRQRWHHRDGVSSMVRPLTKAEIAEGSA